MILTVILQGSDLYIVQQKLSLRLLFTTEVMTVFVLLVLTVPSPVPGPDKEKEREKEKERGREKETGQDKHPFGKDTKDTDDSTNMVKEKEPHKETDMDEKGLDKDEDIQISVFKEPDQGGDKNVSVGTGKDLEKDTDKDPKLDTVGTKDPTKDVPKNTSKEHTEDINRVQEKDTELKKDLGKGLDKDVHVEKGSENVLILKDLRPSKNTSKPGEVAVNTVEEKTSERDKDLEGGLDKDLHPDKGVLGVPKDRDDDDLGRDIEIVLLSEKGKPSVDKDILIRTEYNLEKEESVQQHTVAVTTVTPETTTAPPTPETSYNDLDIKLSRNATDTVSSNDIENFETSAPLEIDKKQDPVGGNITEQSSSGTAEQGKIDSDARKTEVKKTTPDTDTEKHPEKKLTTDPTQPPKVTEESETRKDIKGDSKTGPDNQSVTGKITGNLLFFVQGHRALMNLGNSLKQGLIHCHSLTAGPI